MSIKIKDERNTEMVELGSLEVGTAFLQIIGGKSSLYIVVNEDADSEFTSCFHIPSATIVELHWSKAVHPVEATVVIK